VKSHFELSPAQYERRRQGHLHERRFELVAEVVDSIASAGSLVVEIGCGPGDLLARLGAGRPTLQFLGLDVDSGMVEYARRTHGAENVEYRRADIVDEPPGRAASVVFGIDVLHHVADLEAHVAAVSSLLAPGGCWLAIEPNPRNPYIWLSQERMKRAGLDEVNFPRKRFEAAVGEAPLRIERRWTAFAVPGRFHHVPDVVGRAEKWVERAPVVGGSVVYRLSREP
jgi:trans-aconitate methyltransferase